MKLYPLSAQSEEYLPYAVGGLLYMPAFQENIAAKILGGQIPALMSVAFCLEDAIADDAVLSAEKALLNTLEELQNGAIKTKDSFARILSGDGQKAASAKMAQRVSRRTNVFLIIFICISSYYATGTVVTADFDGFSSVAEIAFVVNPT